MTRRSIDGLEEFIADRLLEYDREARARPTPRDVALVRFARWILDEWASLRAEARQMRATASSLTDDYLAAATTLDAMAAIYEPAIRLLAAVWNTHPDYRREWRPE